MTRLSARLAAWRYRYDLFRRSGAEDSVIGFLIACAMASSFALAAWLVALGC